MSKTPKAFDTKRKPNKPLSVLMPIEWGGTKVFSSISGGSELTRVNCEGLKPPFLILCNHGSFVDFPLVVKAIFPYRTSWVISIEEFIGREWIMRGVGGIYKRKFTADMTVVRHILNALTRQMAIDVAPVRVNAIAPGAIKTHALSTVLTDDMEKMMLKTTPLGRLGAPSDIGNAALFFASPMSSWVSGQTLIVAGGGYQILE